MSKEFHPAFDMPKTKDEALAVLKAWSSPLTLTFSAKKAERCYQLLAAPSTSTENTSETDKR